MILTCEVAAAKLASQGPHMRLLRAGDLDRIKDNRAFIEVIVIVIEMNENKANHLLQGN